MIAYIEELGGMESTLNLQNTEDGVHGLGNCRDIKAHHFVGIEFGHLDVDEFDNFCKLK